MYHLVRAFLDRQVKSNVIASFELREAVFRLERRLVAHSTTLQPFGSIMRARACSVALVFVLPMSIQRSGVDE